MTARTTVRRVAAVAASLLLVALAPQVAHAAVDAVVTIDSPTSGPVWGSQSVQVSATAADGGAQTITSIEVYAGPTLLGTLTVGEGLTCVDETQQACSGSVPWTATAVGLVTLEARLNVLVDSTESQVDTDTVDVTVAAPAPQVVITEPASTSGLKGVVTLEATGSTDVLDPDVPDLLELLVDGSVVDTADCPAAPQNVCTGSLSWDSTPLIGTETLTVRVTTVGGAQGTDSIALGFDNPGPSVTIAAPETLQGSTTISVSGSTDPALSEYPTSIVVKRGATVLNTTDCVQDPQVRSCSDSFTWDSTGLSGNQTLTATITTSEGRTETDTADIAVSSPLATVTLTVPDPTKGVTSVTVSASTDSDLTEYPTQIVVKRGASTVIRTIDCVQVPAVRTCGQTFDWDATGLSGNITLTATVTTTLAGRTASDVVVVAVTTPAPTITLSSPDGGTPLKGVVTVTAGASVDAALTDDPASIAFYDGATLIGTEPCAGSSRECTASVEWDATLLTGTHVLKAVVTTTRGDTAEVTRSVDVDNPGPGVSITDPADATASTPGLITVTATGSVDAALTDSTETMEILLDGVVQESLTVTCSVGAKTCPASFDLDLTNESGTVAVVVRLTTANGATGSDSFTLTVDTPAPAVTVVSTLAGTLLGRIPIGVSASTDAGTSDFPSTIEVLVGGAVIGTITCTAGQHTCSGSRAWDSTVLTSGSRAVTARVTTTDGIQATSVVKTVVFANPAAAVSITSPSSNAVVKGTVSVAVTARTTSPQTDRPRLIRLYVNGALRAEATCAVTTSIYTCSKTLSWNTSSSVGARSIKVQVWTARPGAVSTYVRTASTTRTYYAYSGTRVTLSAPSVVTAGTSVTLKGRVYSTKTGFGIAGVSVRVFRDPALGDSFTTTVTTDKTGLWTLRVQPRTNTRITVTALSKRNPSGTTWLASSSTSAVQPVSAAMSCTVSTPNLTRGQKGSGSCFVPNLPVGTPLALRYLLNGSLFTLANGSSKGQTIPFSFTFPKRGTYFLRVDLSANARFVATRSGLMQVTVR